MLLLLGGLKQKKNNMKINISAYTWIDEDKGSITNFRVCIDDKGKELIFVNTRDENNLKSTMKESIEYQIKKLEKEVIRLDQLRKAIEFIDKENIDWEFVTSNRKKIFVLDDDHDMSEHDFSKPIRPDYDYDMSDPDCFRKEYGEN